MQQQLFCYPPQEALSFNRMGSFEKQQPYNSSESGIPLEQFYSKAPVAPLPSLSCAFPLNLEEISPSYHGAESNYDMRNQAKDNVAALANFQSGQIYSAPAATSYMFLTPGVHLGDWSTSPMVSCGPPLPAHEAPRNISNYTLNFETESYSPSVVLPPLTPRNAENMRHIPSNTQNNPAFAFPLQAQTTMEGYSNSPSSNDVYIQGLPATSTLETKLPTNCNHIGGAPNIGGLTTNLNNTNMAVSLQDPNSPNSFSTPMDSKQMHHNHLLSVKERFPDLWKYGGLDGRFSSHRKDNIDLETLKSHFHLPMVEASKKLGVCVTVLKKICRRFGISRWPHRKLRSVAKHIEKHEKAFHKGYSDHFSYEEVLELCRKNPEKFSNSSKYCGAYKNQEKTSSGSSKLSGRSFDVSLGDGIERMPSGIDESSQEYNRDSNSNTTATTEADQN